MGAGAVTRGMSQERIIFALAVLLFAAIVVLVVVKPF